MHDTTISYNNACPLTVVVVARLQPGMHGGIEQAVIGTVAGLGGLVDGNEEYIVVTDPGARDWLNPYLGPNTRVVAASESPTSEWRRQARRVLKPLHPVLEPLYRGVHRVASSTAHAAWSVAGYDPLIESLSPHVVHFPYQYLHLTSAPSVFNPQDIQHVHYPEYFDRSTHTFRRHMYPLWCRACSIVDVPSAATKDDLVTHLGVPPDKIAVVAKAAPTAVGPASDTAPLPGIRDIYNLPAGFVLYPAQTWPHKNHVRLFEAIALLRDRHGVKLHLVCTGRQNDHWQTLKVRLEELHLAEQVHFLGFVPADHVRALYQLAEFTVFPTLFEGGGFPLLEAFREGSPLACSNIPVLTEQAGDAALFFDPTSVADIARVLAQFHEDRDMREVLRSRGTARLEHYSWDKTARTYRALYRTLANYPLTEDDRLLLTRALGQASHAAATDVDAGSTTR